MENERLQQTLVIENQQLKVKIGDITTSLIYISEKDDQIDKVLGDYLNNYPERKNLKIMFMRESEGVYQFGSRRVMVKVERGKIQIKVGGGFLSIDEFLEQYIPVELERLARNDPLNRFHEKVAVQKTIVDKNAYETSPVRA